MKFYYSEKDDYFITAPKIPGLCCQQFQDFWCSGDYKLEVYKNGIRFFPWGENPNIHKIHKKCPWCGESIKTEKVKDIEDKFIEVYPFCGGRFY